MAALLIVFCHGLAAADGALTPRENAQRLANQAFEARKKADHLETGWQEVYDHGIELANQAIATDPALADGYYALFVNLGKKSERTGIGAQFRNISRLKELLEKTLELDPRHADAWEAKGEMLVRMPRFWGGNASEGEKALRRSAELAPRWSKPELRLAELDWKNGRSAEARSEAERARDLAREEGETDLLGDAEALLKKMDGS